MSGVFWLFSRPYIISIINKTHIQTNIIPIMHSVKSPTNNIIDVEQYEFLQTKKLALNLGYDEFEIDNEPKNKKNISSINNYYDSIRIAHNPYCCGECGNCNY